MPQVTSTFLNSFTRNIKSNILIIALVAIWIGFRFFTPYFWSADHIHDVLPQMAIIAIMACGMVFVIVTGGIDLSVGYGAGFVSVVAAYFLYNGTFDEYVLKIFPSMGPESLQVVVMLLVVLASMILGILLGLYQGFFISWLSVPAFIVTLGGMYIFKSGVLLVTKGKTIFISSNDTYKDIAQGNVAPWVGWVLAIIITAALFIRVFVARGRKQKYGISPGSLTADMAKASVFSVLVLGYVLVVNRSLEKVTDENTVRGVPILVLILGVIAMVMSYISLNTRFGRYTYAIGGNREAARLSGINIRRVILTVYVTMGLLMGVSGMALAAYVGSGTTGAGGGYELDVISACILGGTSTLGGEGTIFGAVVGALIIQSLTNGLQMTNVNTNWQYLIKGVVLILAVLADIHLKKKR